MINCILNYNNCINLSQSEFEKLKIIDNIDPVPNKVWKWGTENRSFLLQAYTKDATELNLFPTAKALITPNGIKFKNMFYTCDLANQEGWFEKTGRQGSWNVNITFDPRDMSVVYLRSNDGKFYHKCTLIDKSKYYGLSLAEINNIDSVEQLLQRKSFLKNAKFNLNLKTEINSIINEATLMRNSSSPSTFYRS